MLDPASEQLAGATMEEVSTVLYYKVLQWAGYLVISRLQRLERKLKKENRHDEFSTSFQRLYRSAWSGMITATMSSLLIVSHS